MRLRNLLLGRAHVQGQGRDAFVGTLQCVPRSRIYPLRLTFKRLIEKRSAETSPSIRSLCLVRFCQGHFSFHVPAVASRPTAHTSERDDDGRSELGQGILDSDGLRSHDAPSD